MYYINQTKVKYGKYFVVAVRYYQYRSIRSDG